MGPALDHIRYQSRRISVRPNAVDGGEVPVLFPRGLPEGIPKEAELTGHMPPRTRPKTTSQGLCLSSGYRTFTLREHRQQSQSIREVDDAGESKSTRRSARHCRYGNAVRRSARMRTNKRLRVTGPFTVESLSPHRTISVEERSEPAEIGRGGQAIKVVGPDQFGPMIMDNLRKAGIQTTDKNERLKFDSLEPFAGQWIHAEGNYTEADGTEKRAAICIGPEHGTVGPELVKEAAKEAVQGVGFDLLIVCGFAFDPHVSEETKRYGNLTVLAARMNPDLSMGDELLKKTGAGNLFMVFGEPDLDGRERRRTASCRRVEIKRRGRVRPDDRRNPLIQHRRHRLLVHRHQLQRRKLLRPPRLLHRRRRALRQAQTRPARRDRRSRLEPALQHHAAAPSTAPETGKIAVKVINHYGDEVLKVYSVE